MDASIITKDCFDGLKKDSEIKDRANKVWTVEVANCGGPGKFTTHLFKDPSGKEEYIFHNGMHVCILDEGKIRNGSICGQFLS